MALPSAGAQAATPQQAIDRLNAQRAAHGIPAGIREIAEWSQACALHNAYQRANGGLLVHDEILGRPGWTERGAWAGRNSVLAATSWDAGNPWEHAPIHLHQLLAPRLSEMGVDDAGDFSCATTIPGRNRTQPASPTVSTYPGHRTTFRTQEVAREAPYTPGERVGIAAGARTGPYLYVMIDGPWDAFAEARITQAELTGPDGPVALRTVDNMTPGLSGFLPTGGQLIPLRPLRARVVYTASIGAVVDGTPVSHRWSFATAARSPNARLTVASEPGAGVVLRYVADSPATTQISLVQPRTGAQAAAALVPGGSAVAQLSAGRWNACFETPPAGEFDGQRGCSTVDVAAAPAAQGSSRLRLTIAPPRIVRRKLVFTLSASPQLRGRRARVTIRRLLRTRGRTRAVGRPLRRTVRLATRTTVRLPRPARNRGYRVLVHVAPFTSATTAHPATSRQRTYIRRR